MYIRVLPEETLTIQGRYFLMLHFDKGVLVRIVAPFAVLQLVDVSTFGCLVTILVIDGGLHLMHPLLKLRDTLEFPVGMVIFERAVRDIVFELSLIHHMTVLVLLPYALLLPVLVGHVDTVLRQQQHRQEKAYQDQKKYSFHFSVIR